MKLSKYLILIIGTSLFVIITVATILINNTNRNDISKMNGVSTDISQANEDTEDLKEVDEAAIETMEEDDYTILLRGSARPKNGEIVVEDAARIGVEEINKEYGLDKKDYSVEMIFLDGILKKTGTWSGHIVLSDDEKYEFLVDGKDGNIEFVKKYD
jgi:hypothetical protein